MNTTPTEAIDLIREIVYEGQELPHWIDYQYCDDQKYAAVNLSYLWDFGDEDEEFADAPLCLWVSWYKTRAYTDGYWLLFGDKDTPPRRPTDDELRMVVKWHVAAAEHAAKPKEPPSVAYPEWVVERDEMDAFSPLERTKDGVNVVVGLTILTDLADFVTRTGLEKVWEVKSVFDVDLDKAKLVFDSKSN